MAYFPFMIELDNKRCLIAGGGTVAYRKVCNMLEFGAEVTVISPKFCPELLELAEEKTKSGSGSDVDIALKQAAASSCATADKGRLTLVQRKVRPSDIEAAFVVIMATDDEKVNHEMAKICRENRILVNVVDVKDDCGFYFPAVIKDKEVVVSVSTGGQSPMLAGMIRRDIERHLDKNYGDIAEKMGELREQVKAKTDDEEERKKIFQQMVRSLLDEC